MLSGLFKLFTSNVSDIVAYALMMVFYVVGQLTAIVAKALNMAVFVEPGGNVLIVETTWKILRDFSNMIFIVLLIYMAFATIFDHGKYRFQDMIVRFLIVAVLINFSLVIGNFIIDACQVLTNIFLGSIGNLGDRLGQYLNPSILLSSEDKGAIISGADMAGGMLISVVFAIILSLIFLFSMLVALVFAIVRVPIIWALLIVSPFAWMSHILPGTNKWWSKWWNLFFGWNLFLPVYLFFMYLGLIFLSQRDTIIGAVLKTAQTASGTNPANDPLLSSLTNSLSFNLVFFYLFAAFVMVGGTWAAKETTSLMGTGFDKGLGWAKGFVKRVPLPYIGNLQAGETATKARYDQFQQEGFKQGGFVNRWTGGAANKIYGGKDAQTRADAKAMDRFGVNERNAVEKQEASEISSYKAKIRNTNTNELRTKMNTGSRTQQLAVRELLKERNQLSGDEIISTYHMYGGDRTENGRKFIGSVDYGKLSGTERENIFKESTDPQVQQKIAIVMAEKGNMGARPADWLARMATDLYAQSSERIEFIQKSEKENFMATINAKSNLATRGLVEIKDGGRTLTTVNDILINRVGKMKADALAEVDKGAWGTLPPGHVPGAAFAPTAFFTAVQNKARVLQIAKRPVAGTAGPPPVPPEPGGGDIFKANLLKEVTDPQKVAMINEIHP